MGELSFSVSQNHMFNHTVLLICSDYSTFTHSGSKVKVGNHFQLYDSLLKCVETMPQGGNAEVSTGLTLNHADVISAVSDSQSDGLLVFLNELHHLSFLKRSDPTADHRLTHTCRTQELQLHTVLQSVRLHTHSLHSICGRCSVH